MRNEGPHLSLVLHRQNCGAVKAPSRGQQRLLARLAAGPVHGACDGTAQGLPSSPEHDSGARERWPTKLALPPLTLLWPQMPGLEAAIGSPWQCDGCCGMQWGL